MSSFCGQVVGVVVMINKRNGCDGSLSVFTNMDEKVRDGRFGPVSTGQEMLELLSNVHYLLCKVCMSLILMLTIYTLTNFVRQLAIHLS